ncbi:MAG TPA: helix-turn-helix domain-containing protein, partial [Puia sp.]|nr:helix-turn-helix domain-containing protein [Puia sp.]
NTLKLEWQRPAIEPLIPLSMDEMDKAHILKVLNGCGWKINGPDGAAEILGLNPNTLRSRLKKLNIARNP